MMAVLSCSYMAVCVQGVRGVRDCTSENQFQLKNTSLPRRSRLTGLTELAVCLFVQSEPILDYQDKALQTIQSE